MLKGTYCPTCGMYIYEKVRERTISPGHLFIPSCLSSNLSLRSPIFYFVHHSAFFLELAIVLVSIALIFFQTVTSPMLFCFLGNFLFLTLDGRQSPILVLFKTEF